MMEFPHFWKVDWHNLWSSLGGVPFMLAGSVKPSVQHVNRIRIFEAVVSALVVGAMSSAAAAYVTMRVMEKQNETIIADAAEYRKVVMGVVTQLAGVQATIVGLVQQQQTFGAQMHERVTTLERRGFDAPRVVPRYVTVPIPMPAAPPVPSGGPRTNKQETQGG